MKLMASFFATLRIHLRYLMVMSLGDLVGTTIFFSVFFDSLSKCPTVLSFFILFETEVTKHKPVPYLCSP